jgi:hypothetical protein
MSECVIPPTMGHADTAKDKHGTILDAANAGGGKDFGVK